MKQLSLKSKLLLGLCGFVLIVILILYNLYRHIQIKEYPRFTVGLVKWKNSSSSSVEFSYIDYNGVERSNRRGMSLPEYYYVVNKTKILVVYNSISPSYAVPVNGVLMNNFDYGENVDYIYNKSALDTLSYSW